MLKKYLQVDDFFVKVRALQVSHFLLFLGFLESELILNVLMYLFDFL